MLKKICKAIMIKNPSHSYQTGLSIALHICPPDLLYLDNRNFFILFSFRFLASIAIREAFEGTSFYQVIWGSWVS